MLLASCEPGFSLGPCAGFFSYFESPSNCNVRAVTASPSAWKLLADHWTILVLRTHYPKFNVENQLPRHSLFKYLVMMIAAYQRKTGYNTCVCEQLHPMDQSIRPWNFMLVFLYKQFGRPSGINLWICFSLLCL